jgi:hypothetical protein
MPSTAARLVRALVPVVIVGLILGMSACGGDEDADAQPAADAGTRSGLGIERFKELDAVYVAALPLEAVAEDEDARPSEWAAVLREFLVECNKITPQDALRANFRRFCPLTAQLQEQFTAIGACQADLDPEACTKDAVVDVRRIVRGYLALGQRFDRAVARAKLTPACRTALENPELSYEVMRGYGRAMAYLQRALRDSSVEDNETAQQILEETDARAEDLPKPKEAHAKFRSGCA